MSDGSLPTTESTSLERHLARCSDCAGVYKQLESGQRHGFPLVDPNTYEVGPIIGYGGMGQIRRAVDRRLGREVAIKDLLFDTPLLRARFAREVRVAARLQHPNIVPIYDVGSWSDGTPFYTMRLVEGRSLGAALAAADSLRERLRLLPSLLSAAGAVAYAHGVGIVHRDLTPANILLGPFGETVVIDWGLAKSLRVDQSRVAPEYRTGHTQQILTPDGTVIGSPAYMPPEQARAEACDERADVYALGAILYEILEGRAPYGGSTRSILAVIRAGSQPVFGRGTPRALARIARKAMAFDKVDRYATVEALIAALGGVQAGSLIPGLDRLGRWFGDRKTGLALGATALTAAIAMIST